MKIKNIVLLLSVLLVNCNSQLPKLVQNEKLANQLFYSLELEKDSFFVEEIIPFYFVIENKSNQAIFVDNYLHGYYIDGEKIGGFDLIVQADNGAILDPQNTISLVSGRYGIVRVAPMDTYKIRINDLSKYAINKMPGNYEVRVKSELKIFLNKKEKKKRGQNSAKDYKKYLMTNPKVQTKVRVVAVKE